MKLNKLQTKLLAASAVAALAANGSLALAQQDGVAADDEKRLDTVVATGVRGFTEDVQDVPDSVTVFNAELIADAGIDSLQGIADIAPNVHLNDSFRKGTVRLNVRGFGTPQAGEAPVAFVVDGQTVQDVEFINQGIFDVDNIQVLRGPAGAVYGQGALAGAILINSKQPTNEFTGNIQTRYESGADLRVSGALSGPIIEDQVMFRLGGYVNQRDGQIDNLVGQKVDYVDGAYALRGMLQFILSENVELKLTGSTADGEYGYGIQYRIPTAEFNNGDFYDRALSNFVGREPQQSNSFSAQLDWDLGWSELQSVTNYSDIDDRIWLERDAGTVLAVPENILPRTSEVIQIADNQIEGFSQEFRLKSNDDQAFRWAVGASYRNRERTYLFGTQADPGNNIYPAFIRGTAAVRDDVTTESEDVGAFAFAAFDITDRLEVSGAVRYDENKREEAQIFGNGTIFSNFSKTFSEFQPKLGVTYDVTEDIMIYGSYSRGYRPGGANNPGYLLSPNEFQSEISDAYELGWKSEWFDGAFLLNGAIFTNEVENYQTTIFSGTIGNVNLVDTPISGFEVEGSYRPTDALAVNFSYGQTDADIDVYQIPGDSNSGNRVPFVPEYTFNASITHDADIGENLSLRSYLAYRSVGEMYFRQDNRSARDPNSYLDAKVTLGIGDEWEVAGYVNNMFDYREAVHYFLSGGGNVVTPNQPRSVGISIRKEF